MVSALREQYDAWFDDVKSSRSFEPGVIHIGSDQENPTVLSRYQDSTYKNGQPTGWQVEIERAAKYQATIDRGAEVEATTMYVKVNEQVTSEALGEGSNEAVFELPAGRATLDIWVQQPNEPRVIIFDNGTLGNVVLRRLP